MYIEKECGEAAFVFHAPLRPVYTRFPPNQFCVQGVRYARAHKISLYSIGRRHRTITTYTRRRIQVKTIEAKRAKN